MVKADLVRRVARQSQLPQGKAALAVDVILERMKAALRSGKRVDLRGFGVFQLGERKRGRGRNPRTGTETLIAPGKTVRFKPGPKLRDLN